MGSTDKTPNLNLSQFLDGDKPDWLTDYNGDMAKVDAQTMATNNYDPCEEVKEAGGIPSYLPPKAMAKADYDPNGTVLDAGGIVEYVDGLPVVLKSVWSGTWTSGDLS